MQVLGQYLELKSSFSTTGLHGNFLIQQKASLFLREVLFIKATKRLLNGNRCSRREHSSLWKLYFAREKFLYIRCLPEEKSSLCKLRLENNPSLENVAIFLKICADLLLIKMKFPHPAILFLKRKDLNISNI